MRAFLTAVQFLTRVPVPGGDRPAQASDLRRATLFFPLVGSLVGSVTAAVVWGTEVFWIPLVAALLGLAVEAFLTGGFHEDAVADFFDAAGGGWTRDDILRILKDSRIGSYGALALGLGVLFRTTTIAELATFEEARLLAAVVASATLGRWVILVQMAILPPVAGRESLSRDVGQRLGFRDVLIGTFWALPGTVAFAFLFPLRATVALLALFLLVFFFHRYLERRLGGVTGDCLGCLCYLGQIVVLLSASLKLPEMAR